MKRMRPVKAEQENASLQCKDCQSLALAEEPYCGACGGRLGPRKKSKVAYDAAATFIGVVAVILYLVARS